MRRFIIWIIIIHLSMACGDNCKDIDCFSPPKTFYFEILNKQTRENLFASGTYQPSQISVTYTDNNSYNFNTETNIIEISGIGSETETITLTFNIADQVIFNFYVDAERLSGRLLFIYKN